MRLFYLIVFGNLKTDNIMNLELIKSDRNTGYFFHKSKGLNCTVSKSVAMKDISKECLRQGGDLYNVNYIHKEAMILRNISLSELNLYTLELKQY